MFWYENNYKSMHLQIRTRFITDVISGYCKYMEREMSMKIIKFEKKDCNPCAMVSELLDRNGVEYEKVNPFDNPEMAVQFKVRSVPTTILMDNDVEVRRIIGFKPEELNEIMEMI